MSNWTPGPDPDPPGGDDGEGPTDADADPAVPPWLPPSATPPTWQPPRSRPRPDPPLPNPPPWQPRRFPAGAGASPTAGAGAAGPGPGAPAVPWSPPETTIPSGVTVGGGDTLLMTVVAPGGGRTSTRVPADVPVARLAPGLGTVVNVANVSDLDDDRGTRIPSASTLAEAGMQDGSTVHVVAPGITRPAGPGPSARPEGVRPGPPRPTGAPPATTRSSAGVPTPIAVLAAVVAAVVFFVLGGVVLGSGSPAPGPGAVAGRAATAWLQARPFAGPLAPGVPARLGRIGAFAVTDMQSAGAWHHGRDAGETFVVVPTSPPPANTPFAITVVTTDGRIAFPPTVSLIPVVNGRMPPAPGGSKITNGGPVPGPVAAWAQAQFGPQGVQPPLLQLGLTAGPTVMASWSPAAGGRVFRLRVPLDSRAPGTADAKLVGTDQALVARVTTDTTTVQNDQAALAQAQAQARAAQAAAATANPPNPPPLVAAFATANGAAIAAAQKLNADTATLGSDRDAATKAGATAQGATETAAVATYDVWMRAQAVVGWAPAAYGVTG